MHKIKGFFKDGLVFVSNFFYSVKVFYRPEKILFWLVFTVTIAGTLLPFASSKFQGEIIDRLIAQITEGAGSIRFIIVLVILWAVIQGSTSIIGLLRRYTFSKWQFKVQIVHEMEILKKRTRIDTAVREQEWYQNLQQRAFENGPWSLWNLGNGVFRHAGNIAAILLATSILGFYNPIIYAIILATTIPQLIVNIKYGKQIHGIWSAGEGKTRRLYFYFRGLIGGKHLEVNNTDTVFYNKVKALHEATQREIHTTDLRRLWSTFATELIALGGFTACLVMIVMSVLDGGTSIGQLTFLMAVVNRFTNSIEAIFENIASDYAFSLQVTDMRKWFAIAPHIDLDAGDEYKPLDHHDGTGLAPHIEFKNVSFRYPSIGNSENYVLKNVNLDIKPGERIALIGINGAGKSTLIKLLLRMYDPTEGEILVNGNNLRTFSPRSWRSHISALLQDFDIILMKAKEAIWSNVDPDNGNDPQAIVAAKMSTSDQFIKKWKNEYEEQLGKNLGGQELSKGQRQKLALAAVFYKNSPFIILDEPTSAIDSESEIEIFKAIEQLPRSKTILFVSHDMAVVRNADRIVVLENETITENGSHAELMEKGGVYAKIYTEQLNQMTK